METISPAQNYCVQLPPPSQDDLYAVIKQGKSLSNRLAKDKIQALPEQQLETLRLRSPPVQFQCCCLGSSPLALRNYVVGSSCIKIPRGAFCVTPTAPSPTVDDTLTNVTVPCNPGWWHCPKYRQLADFCSAATHPPLEVWSCFHLGPDEIEMSLEIDFQFNQKGNLFLGLSKWKVTL